MHTSVRPYVTTGIALVAAGTLIVAPITAPPNEVVRPVQMAAEAVVHTATASRLLAEALSLTGSGVAGALSDAADVGVGTPVGATGALQVLLGALQQSGVNVLDFLEAAPGTLDNLVQAVVADPTLLPNAFSSVLYALFAIPGLGLGGQTNPYLSGMTSVPVAGSLLGAVLRPILVALEDVLPAPLGGTTGLVADAGGALSAVVDGLLSLLPAPLQRLNTNTNTTTTATTTAAAMSANPGLGTILADGLKALIGAIAAVPGEIDGQIADGLQALQNGLGPIIKELDVTLPPALSGPVVTAAQALDSFLAAAEKFFAPARAKAASSVTASRQNSTVVAATALTPAAPVGRPLPVAHQVLRSTVQVGRAAISAPGTVAVTAGTDRASLTESGSHHSVRLAAASPNRAAPAALMGGRHRAAH